MPLLLPSVLVHRDTVLWKADFPGVHHTGDV